MAQCEDTEPFVYGQALRTERVKRLSPPSASPVQGQWSRANLTRLAAVCWWPPAIALIALLVLLPYFKAGDPPGVDSPTFLHFSWVFEQYLKGSGGSALNDPWWYSGIPYLQAYSPLGYGSVGLLAAASPFDLATSYKIVMVIALIASAFTTFWLGRVLGLKPLYAFLGAALFILSYPVIAGIGIFGWLPTLVSMPMAMAAYIYVEKWTERKNARPALIAGALLGAALVAHHMTAIAIGMAIVVRLAVFVTDNREEWRSAMRSLALIGAAAAAVSVWWAVPFLVNTISVGFERELPGNWQFGTGTFISNVFDRGLIGVETHPSYIGLIQGAVGIAGAIYAIVYRTRLRGLAIAAIVLFWFSMGASANPLIRVYPLSGLDVSRFTFYAAPMLALLTAAMAQLASQTRHTVKYPATGLAIAAIALVLPIADTLAARDTLAPVEEPQHVTETIDWLSENIPAESRGLAIGYRNWDGYWLPARAGLPIMDGWYDEGASNWREIRDYRLMGWLRDVDVDRLHNIMAGQDTEYLVVTQWDITDNPRLFRDSINERPDLFEVIAELDQSVIYRRQ